MGSPVRAYFEDLAPSGIPAMRSGLRAITRVLRWRAGQDLDGYPWHRLRRSETQAVRAELAHRYAPRSANRMLSALRQVLRRCWQDGEMPRDEYLLAVDLKPIPVREPPTGRALETREIEALVRAARTRGGSVGLRDAALVATLFGAGLRRIEVARSTVSDYDVPNKEIRVCGKGSIYRTVPFLRGWETNLEEWIRFYPQGPLFPRIGKRGVSTKSMSPDDVSDVAAELRTATGIQFTPHDLRRSFGTYLRDHGVDLGLVKMLMGHKHIQTTTIYDRRGEAAKRRAILALPGREGIS